MEQFRFCGNIKAELLELWVQLVGFFNYEDRFDRTWIGKWRDRKIISLRNGLVRLVNKL